MDKNLKLVDLINKIKEEEGTEIKDLGIEVKKYVDIATKEYIIRGFKDDETTKGMLGHCTYVENGITYFDPIMAEVMMKINIMIYYTNVNLTGIENIYDEIMQTGIFDYVISKIPQGEINLLNELTNNTLSNVISNRNLPQTVIHGLIEEIIKKIPSETKFKNMLKKLETIDFSKFSTIKDLYSFAKNK